MHDAAFLPIDPEVGAGTSHIRGGTDLIRLAEELAHALLRLACLHEQAQTLVQRVATL